MSVFMSLWRSPFFEMIKISSSSSPRDMKFCTQLPYDPHGHIPSLGGSPTNPRMVTHQHKDGHPPNQRWSPTWRKCTTDMEFGTYTLLTKIRLGENYHGWSPTNPRMVTHQPKEVHHQPKDGHTPEGNVLQTSNWALRHYLQKYHQVATAMHSHLSTLGWSPTNPRMVTHQKEV